MKVCFATGSRAEYGLLRPLMKAARERFYLQTVVTGSHLLNDFGNTIKEFEQDGLPISAKINMALDDTVAIEIVKRMGDGLKSCGEVFKELKPDILIILGDRYEMLVVAIAALLLNIPVAHIGGGDITEGAFDESIRHSITKMSHIHFPTNLISARNIEQLGENPANIYMVGSLAIDSIVSINYFDRSTFFKKN